MTDLQKLLETEDHIIQEIQSNLSVYATILSWKAEDELKIAYASSPITTGKRLFEALKMHGVKSAEELKNANLEEYRQIFKENLIHAEKFANSLRKKGEYHHVISPATFFMKGWTQEHYMSFWERVIKTFRPVIHLNIDGGWNYSNGCAEESLIGFSVQLPVYEGIQTQETLDSVQAADSIKKAIDQISIIGADIKPLYNIYRKLDLLAFAENKKSEYNQLLLDS